MTIVIGHKSRFFNQSDCLLFERELRCSWWIAGTENKFEVTINMADSGDVVCGAEVVLLAKVISNDTTSILIDFLNYNAKHNRVSEKVGIAKLC